MTSNTLSIPQLNMNFKAVIPEIGQETIVTTNTPGWKDTRLKIGITGAGAGITMRSFGKSLAKTAIDAEPFAVSRDIFAQIVTATFGRQYGAERRIAMVARQFNTHEVQYTTLMNNVDAAVGGSLTPEQKNALTMWIAVVLQDAADIARWGGPVDIIVSRRTDRIVATDDIITTEHLVWTYINQYESRIKPAFANLKKFLTDKVGYYDINTIAETLFIQWTGQQIDVRREKAVFMSRQEQFKSAVAYILKGLPSIPDPLSSTVDLAEFLKVSNYLMNVNLTGANVRPPQSYAEARSFMNTVRAIASSPNTKIEIVPTLSFQKLFNVRTASFRSGVDGSDLRDISLNYSGSDVIRAGEMVEFTGDYKQWSEDPALSTALSSIIKAVLTNLRKIKDIRLEAWASVVDNMSDVSIWFEESEDNKRIDEIKRVIQAYAIAGAAWLTRDLNSWVYGILSPSMLSMASSDAAYSMRGTTTKRPEVAVSLMLTDKDGDPFIGNPTPFYKSDRTTYLLAEENKHYRLLRSKADEDDIDSTIPKVVFQAIETDGTAFTGVLPLSSLVSGAFPTTRAMLSNVALVAEVEHLEAQLNESLQMDEVLTGELLVPTLKNIAKIATDAFGNYIETEVLRFTASMTDVKKNSFRMYTVLNSINLLIAVCEFIEPELSHLLNTLFKFALADRDINRTILGVL